MIAPPGRIVEGYELVDVFLNVRQDQRAVGTGSPRRGQVAGFVPFGYTLADSPTRIEPPDGVTASWLLNFDELTASTITFRSSNRVSVTTPPTYIHHPGREIPGRVILAQTGADLALIVLAAAVLAAGAFLIVAARRRRSDSAKAEG